VPWDGGPYGESARELLLTHSDRIRKRLRSYDELIRSLPGSSEQWVVTHGEPHSANVIRDTAGGLRLVDWDTTLVGPRERDLWMVLDRDLTGWDEYHHEAVAVELCEEMLRLYRDRWALAEICVVVAGFRRPHGETDDTRLCWDNLVRYLS